MKPYEDIKYPVGKGWWDLLDEYIPKLEQAGGGIKNVVIPFEKYGALHIGEINMNADIISLLDELESKSTVTCEDCGANGDEKELTIGRSDHKYIKTLCDSCFNHRETKQNDPFYSESNIKHLEKIVADIHSDKAHLVEHDLTEVEIERE